ncbi:MAG TPA: DNA polymerase domain-containing protein [Thermodesulfobacteriota bacterium]|nr:DNA polymerase domain-containing protein [Thermodesulfobacteriota bacterium]
MEIQGRLFDLYPLESSMILWIKEEDGGLRRLEDPFRPRFYAQGKKSDLLDLFHSLQRGHRAAGYQWTRKKEFWSGDEVEVIEVEVVDSEHYAQLPRILPPWEEKITFYNCDIPLSQTYLYAKEIFPTGRCLIEVEGNRVFEIHPDPSESVWVDDEDIFDLRVMELRMDGDSFRKKSLLLECEGYRVETETIDVGEVDKFVRHFDPDVILSEDGDASLLPLLFSGETRWKISIPWDREPYPVKRQVPPKGFSYFSYGRTYYRAPAHLFLGRWHIDRKNSFIYGESGMEGVIELARLAKIPVQRMARTSPGTAITSMQLDRAFQEDILIPWRKGEPEKFKTAWDLLVGDKGGLVFQPKLGIFEDVAEIDFASMYPTLMAIHNISPETVLCGCCENHRVPETGYTICEKREGIVPKTLRPILIRRAWLKKMAKESNCGMRNADCGINKENTNDCEEKMGNEEKRREIHNRKQTALKWMLVTCFGYLGYRNARFGRIEAHEAVTAFGRESLLQAKEICEEEGFELLHAMTDSLWIQKKGLREEEVLELCRKISEATGITMSLEGIYRWMAFLPSKGNPENPVANRYFGLFQNGKIKARGLAFRRSDTPPLVQKAQLRMLEILAGTKDRDDYRMKIPKVLDLLLEYSLMLKDGRAKNEDLAIGKRISQEPSAYKVDSLTALAAQELEDIGIPIHPGEKVRYVIKDAESKDKAERVRPFPLVGPDDTYDVKKYLDLLVKATEEILIHVGYDKKRLKTGAHPIFEGERK